MHRYWVLLFKFHKMGGSYCNTCHISHDNIIASATSTTTIAKLSRCGVKNSKYMLALRMWWVRYFCRLKILTSSSDIQPTRMTWQPFHHHHHFNSIIIIIIWHCVLESEKWITYVQVTRPSDLSASPELLPVLLVPPPQLDWDTWWATQKEACTATFCAAGIEYRDERFTDIL